MLSTGKESCLKSLSWLRLMRINDVLLEDDSKRVGLIISTPLVCLCGAGIVQRKAQSEAAKIHIRRAQRHT